LKLPESFSTTFDEPDDETELVACAHLIVGRLAGENWREKFVRVPQPVADWILDDRVSGRDFCSE